MYKNLDACFFNYKDDYYRLTFENILRGIFICYQLLIKNNAPVADDENKIRDELLFKYLCNPNIRKKVEIDDFLFDSETQEISGGKVDIKIQSHFSFHNPQLYYTIECKRLNSSNTKGKYGLNGKYIEDGILRFVNGKYSTNCGINGLFGFLVESLDISSNTNDINYVMQNHFKESNIIKELTSTNIIPNYKYQYYSKHKSNKHGVITLYHIMLDFSKIIVH